jgi:hypothetical protein
LGLVLAQTGSGQVLARKPKLKGPRATGLVELAPNGKAHLIPITIMIDGKFYDASAYKADPVPFALESYVVYEALKTGVPQGEFTVTGALQAQDAWFGEGKWVPESSKPKKKKVAEAKPNLDDDSGPPTLRRAEGSKSSDSPASSTSPSGNKSSTPPASSPSPAPSTTPASAAGGHPDDKNSSAGQTSGDSAASTTSKPSTEDSSETANDEDPNRPTLKRGKQPAKPASASSDQPTLAASSAGSKSAGASPGATKPKETGKASGTIQLLPAVSDAGGPEPRPYNFEMKPDEEQSYRKKLMVLASAEVVAKAKQMTPVMPSAAPPKRTPAKAAAKSVQPTFDNIQFRAFDLSDTNEPVFVMSADAHLPSANSSETGRKATYFITLVAKADIYLDLHKLMAQVTDDHHLDEFPRFELIDAVDADGDGRGELLFREVSEAGTAWAVYRAAADQLYPLFEGKPQQSHPMPVSAQ